MNDREPHSEPRSGEEQQLAAVEARERRAREREAWALEHAREDGRQATEASDPVIAAAHHRAEQTHVRAAKLHREAAGFQARHADEHSD